MRFAGARAAGDRQCSPQRRQDVVRDARREIRGYFHLFGGADGRRESSDLKPTPFERIPFGFRVFDFLLIVFDRFSPKIDTFPRRFSGSPKAYDKTGLGSPENPGILMCGFPTAASIGRSVF